MADNPDDDATQYGRILREIYRSLGRVENAVEDLKETSKATIAERDQKFREHNSKLDMLAERQQADATSVLKTQERMTAQIAVVGTKVTVVSETLDNQDHRLSEIEAPIKRALLAREVRQKEFRKIWGRFILIATAASTAAGLLIEPIWREFFAVWFRSYFGK